MAGDGYTLRIAFNKLALDKATLAQAADAIVRKTAADIVAETQQNIRANKQIKTGNMLNSVQMEVVGPAHARVSVGADYGIYQELGTRFMPGRPFFYPAVNHQWDAFIQAFKELGRIFG